MKKDNSAFIGITIGVILFLLMIPALVQMSNDDASYQLYSTECDHDHEDDYDQESIDHSFNSYSSTSEKDRHDSYVLKRMIGDPSYKYTPEHYMYNEIYKGFLPK